MSGDTPTRTTSMRRSSTRSSKAMAQTTEVRRAATRGQSSSASRRTSITQGRAELLLRAEVAGAAEADHMEETERVAKTSAAKALGRMTVAVTDMVALKSSTTSALANLQEVLTVAEVDAEAAVVAVVVAVVVAAVVVAVAAEVAAEAAETELNRPF